MALLHLTTAPKTEDFTPLEEHQAQTPATFFDAKPVLHAKQAGMTLSAPASRLQEDPAFSTFRAEIDGDDALVKDVDIWVSSENLILFQNLPSPTGVSISYPSIALHATMKWKSEVEALFMNISLNDAETVNDDDDIQILELTLLPPNYSAEPEVACIKDIFVAMNTCADLHPDPDSNEAEANDDETAPGATGWITADNMDDYMDENGNFRGTVYGSEDLGPGAGTVRQREDGDDEEPSDVNGVSNDSHEDKYQRTG